MEQPTGTIDPHSRIDALLARAEQAGRRATMEQAEQFAAVHAALREAQRSPETYLGPLLAADPEAADFADRAAIADLAVRLRVAEASVRAMRDQAASLMHRAPAVWQRFCTGEIATANARAIASAVASLPLESCPEFERAVLVRAATQSPARFAATARSVRERLAPDPAERHRTAAEARHVRLDRALDGMSWLSLFLPSVAAERAMAQLDGRARALAGAADEARTLSQLRADVAADLLAGVLGARPAARAGAVTSASSHTDVNPTSPSSATPVPADAGHSSPPLPAVGVSVAVTVPVLTLLGAGDESGTLEGVGPIDAATARRLAGHAPSFTRILTHPVTGAVLDVDRTTYRVPADLKRWLGIRDGGTCTFPGCGRPARDCDLDHTLAWADGGITSAANLAHLCRNHHRLKHTTAWTMRQTDAGIRWRSPTGHESGNDPPPF